MHPWGKWGRRFVEYGVAAARAALADAGVAWADVELVVGGETVRNGYAGYVAGATFAQALGLERRPRRHVVRRLRHRRARPSTPPGPGSSPACATSPSSSAPTPPRRGSWRPNAGERWDDPDWLRFRLLGTTNPAYFAPLRPPPDGPLRRDRRGLRPGEGEERPPRAATTPTPATARRSPSRTCWPRRWSPTRCACSTSAPPPTARAAVVLTSMDYARRHGASPTPVRVARRLDGDADLPEHGHRHAQLRHRLRRRSSPAAERHVQGVDRRTPPTRRPGIGPEDVEPGRGLRPVHRPRARLVRGHRPVQARRGREAAARRRHHASAAASRSTRRGGLACFGEAVPAQALAQVCEVDLAAARPGRAAARSRAPGSASPPTRACSATARRCCCRREPTDGPDVDRGRGGVPGRGPELARGATCRPGTTRSAATPSPVTPPKVSSSTSTGSGCCSPTSGRSCHGRRSTAA